LWAVILIVLGVYVLPLILIRVCSLPLTDNSAFYTSIQIWLSTINEKWCTLLREILVLQIWHIVIEYQLPFSLTLLYILINLVIIQNIGWVARYGWIATSNRMLMQISDTTMMSRGDMILKVSHWGISSSNTKMFRFSECGLGTCLRSMTLETLFHFNLN
jgi:hypothetical protein